jgi:hypothetical protein
MVIRAAVLQRDRLLFLVAGRLLFSILIASTLRLSRFLLLSASLHLSSLVLGCSKDVGIRDKRMFLVTFHHGEPGQDVEVGEVRTLFEEDDPFGRRE